MGIRAIVKLIKKFLSIVTVAFQFCLVLRPILFHSDILIPLNSDDFLSLQGLFREWKELKFFVCGITERMTPQSSDFQSVTLIAQIF